MRLLRYFLDKEVFASACLCMFKSRMRMCKPSFGAQSIIFFVLNFFYASGMFPTPPPMGANQ